MDKRLKKMVTGPAHHAPTGVKRLTSHDQGGMARPSQFIRDRRRASSHDSQAAEPGEEESVTDFTKAELMVFKTSFARPKFANTYRMEPYKKFMDFLVKKKAEEILMGKLQDYKYTGFNAAATCTSLAENILAAVKEFNFDRYKYIVKIFMVERTGQSVHISSRWVWDVARDNWVSVQYETETYVTVVLVVACYYE